jgi:hypothetical protein
MRDWRRNRLPAQRLIPEPDFGGDMRTDKSLLEKITARMKEIVRIAEDAASHAMKAEQPARLKQSSPRPGGELRPQRR